MPLQGIVIDAAALLLCVFAVRLCCARRSILFPRDSSESFISDSLKFIGVMLVSQTCVSA